MAKMRTNRSKSSIIQIIEQNLFEHSRLFTTLPGTRVEKNLDVFWFETGIKEPLLNGVLMSQFRANNAQEKINQLIAHFKNRNLDMSWQIGPSTQPSDTYKYLVNKGFVNIEHSIGMAIELSNISHLPFVNGLRIQTITNIQALREWVETFRLAYPLSKEYGDAAFKAYAKAGINDPNLCIHFIGFLKRKPIATSSLFLDSNAAGVYNVSTHPKMRRKGIGSAMTIFALLKAKNLGFNICVLQASETGANVYKNLGFDDYCKFALYLTNYH